MRYVALSLLMALTPVGVAAQDVAGTFEELRRQQVLEEGQTIWITFDFEGNGDYRQMEVQAVDLTDSAIVVLVDSLPRGTTTLRMETVPGGTQVEIPEHRVQRIETKPRGLSHGAGALVGAGAGAAAFIGLAALCTRGNETGGGCDFGAGSGAMLSVGLIGGGAIAGAMLASPQEGDLVFLSEEPGGSSRSFFLSPLLSRQEKGVQVSLIW